MSQGGIFGDARREQLAIGAAAACRREFFPPPTPEWALEQGAAAAFAAVAEAVVKRETQQQLYTNDARWALPMVVRERAYDQIAACHRFKEESAAFAEKFLERERAARGGLVIARTLAEAEQLA
jgi:hypothetical protein